MPAAFDISWRPATAVLALIIASLAMPSAAQAKRLFGGVKPMPRNSVTKAPKPPVAPAAPMAPAATQVPATTVAPAKRSPGVLGTAGAVAVGAAAGSMAGTALAGGKSSDEDRQAKEAQALAAEKEAHELQRQADAAKHRAEVARAAVN